MFMNDLQETLNGEKQLTENGAVGYRTSGKKLLDLNFKVSSLRSEKTDQIKKLYSDAFYENPILALRWLFFARDVREGIGERRLFRVCLDWLTENRPELVKALLPLVSEYGRFDDIWNLIEKNDEVTETIVSLIRDQLAEDTKNAKAGKPISLLAKWLPRANTSSKNTVALAKLLCKNLDMKEAQYRKTVAALNKYLKTTEIAMSKGEWNEIDYKAVPSRANLLYNNAFLRHDETRRRAYLESLKRGETKINAGVLFPQDIVHKYTNGNSSLAINTDDTLEELWKNLPDYVNGAGNTIVVADGSGSMTDTIGNTKVSALDAANALAIYFAERSSGEFKDQYITFSDRPQLVSFKNAKTLREKIGIALKHNEVASTNIEAVFKLILKTAVDKELSQKDLPANILILSDMEFNMATGSSFYSRTRFKAPSKALFEKLADLYKEYGYKLPRLVFWNLNSRTGTIPVQENEMGVALVSGFSPVIVNMVLSGELDPYKCLLNEIGRERYDRIEQVVADLL